MSAAPLGRDAIATPTITLGDAFAPRAPEPPFGRSCSCRGCDREPIAIVEVISNRDGRRRGLRYCRRHALGHLEWFGAHPVRWFDVCSLRHCDRLAVARLRGSRIGDRERDLFGCGGHESIIRRLWHARIVERLDDGRSS